MLRLDLQAPVIYLITKNQTNAGTLPTSDEFERVLALVRAAVDAGIELVQLREKDLRPRTLYELAKQAAQITKGSRTRLLVNDRADIAYASGADGVHLTTRSLQTQIVRQTFGSAFLIGVSTHSLCEAANAQVDGADFVTFGPVYRTPSKSDYNLPPLGLGKLTEAAIALRRFPLIALGGIASCEQASDVLQAGSAGVAAIRLFSDDPEQLRKTVCVLRASQTHLLQREPTDP